MRVLASGLTMIAEQTFAMQLQALREARAAEKRGSVKGSTRGSVSKPKTGWT